MCRPTLRYLETDIASYNVSAEGLGGLPHTLTELKLCGVLALGRDEVKVCVCLCLCVLPVVYCCLVYCVCHSLCALVRARLHMPVCVCVCVCVCLFTGTV